MKPGAARWLLCVLAVSATGVVVLQSLRGAGSALVVSKSIADPDSILVLASHEWQRIPAAATLARVHRHARVLITDPLHPTSASCFRCGERVEWLEELGVDRRRIVALPLTLDNTFGEALAAREYIARVGVHRLLVVTSPYHTRRALATFHHVLADSGTEVGMHPALETSRYNPSAWWAGRADTLYVLYEWLAIPYYVIRHGISPAQFQNRALQPPDKSARAAAGAGARTTRPSPWTPGPPVS